MRKDELSELLEIAKRAASIAGAVSIEDRRIDDRPLARLVGSKLNNSRLMFSIDFVI